MVGDSREICGSWDCIVLQEEKRDKGEDGHVGVGVQGQGPRNCPATDDIADREKSLFEAPHEERAAKDYPRRATMKRKPISVIGFAVAGSVVTIAGLREVSRREMCQSCRGSWKDNRLAARRRRR